MYSKGIKKSLHTTDLCIYELTFASPFLDLAPPCLNEFIFIIHKLVSRPHLDLCHLVLIVEDELGKKRNYKNMSPLYSLVRKQRRKQHSYKAVSLLFTLSINGSLQTTLLSYISFIPLSVSLQQVSMIHMIVLMLLLIPFLSYLNVPPTPDVTRKFYTKRLVPLAIGKLLGAIFTHFSIWKVPISYAHTSKK